MAARLVVAVAWLAAVCGAVPVEVVRGRNEMGSGSDHAVRCASTAPADDTTELLELQRPTVVVAEHRQEVKQDCVQSSRSVTVTNHNRVTHGGDALPAEAADAAESSSAAASEKDGADDEDVEDPGEVTVKLAAQATSFEARIVAWNAEGSFYGTPENQPVASFTGHPRGGFVQFEFSSGVPMQGAAVYLDGDEMGRFGSSWSVQYRRSCESPPPGDRWRDAVPSTGPLRRGWNTFKWAAPEPQFRCWRWLLLDAGGATPAYTEYRWYPRMPSTRERVEAVAERLAACEEEAWSDAEALFPWAAVGAPPQYRRDCDGVVRLRGLVSFEARELKRVSALTNPPVLRLPDGYRPSQWSAFVAATGRGAARAEGGRGAFDVVRNRGWAGAVYVQTDGAVAAQVFDTEFVSLDQVVFSAAAQDSQWAEPDPTGPFTPFYGTRLGFRADSNGRVQLRGAASTSPEDARQLQADADDPMRRDVGVIELPVGARPLHAVTCPAVTGHVPAARLAPRVDKVVNAVVPGTVRVEADGRVLPRAFDAGFVSLEGLAWTSAALEREWRAAAVLRPWRADGGQVQYRRDNDGNVHLRGRVTAARDDDSPLRYGEEPAAAMVLPRGFRPARVTVLVAATGPGPAAAVNGLFDAVLDRGLAGTVYVLPDGRLMPVMFNDGYVSLDCISFSTE